MRYYINQCPDYIWNDVVYRITETGEASYWCMDRWSEGELLSVLEESGEINLRPSCLLEQLLLYPEVPV